tara:strand:+ start:632 stop:1735 length:1104 start_codon:yes stop_codon:yes gene_type:complete
MAQQTVGIGSSANDGTGDPLRTAFTKINENFTELYATTGMDTDKGIDINANTITSTRTNDDIIIDPNGTGKIELAADVEIDNGLNINGATITALTTNGNITITPNGTGGVVLDSIKVTENEIAATNTNDDLVLSAAGTGNVVMGAIRINGSQISSDDSNAIQIKETLQVDNLSSDDSSALNVTSGMTIAGAVDVGGTLSASSIDVNTISSSDSSGVIINDGLSVAGPLNGSGSSVLQISDGVDIENELTVEGNTNADGNLFTGGYQAYSVTETLTGAGGSNAISVTNGVTFLNTGGGTATLTIADGVVGQMKHIIMVVAGNNAILANTNVNVATQILFNAVGETATLMFDTTTNKWNVLAVNGATIS